MKSFWERIWSEDEGVLTFEWILLVTVLLIGIVGALSAVRDAVITELGDVVGAVVNIDQSYTVVTDPCSGVGNTFFFQDALPACFQTQRSSLMGQGPVSDQCGN